MKHFAVPKKISSKELIRLRNTFGLTQHEFAELLGFSPQSIARWEQGGNIPAYVASMAMYLRTFPDYVKRIEIPEQTLPLRLYYMYQDFPCTLIDADERKHIVTIQNFTDNPQFRAFGANEIPSYEDFNTFLASRCFPDSRDGIKLILRDLDLPFYDPLLIIKKTEGRMAEDDFWIKIAE